MSQADNILFFDAIFSILLFAFGAGTGAVNLAAFQTLQAPTLAPQPGQISCNNLDFACNASKGIAQATAYIGWAIVNLPVILLFLIALFFLFGSTILQLTFSQSFSAQGVPFLGFIWVGLQLYIVADIMRTLRGSSVGV